MNNRRLFCEEDNMGEECRKLALEHPTCSAFWQNCPRSDWMLWLLEVNEFRNADKLLEYLRRLKAQTNLTPSIESYHQWRKELDEGVERRKAQLNEDLAGGSIDQGYVRFALWNSAWSIAQTEITNIMRDVLFEAKSKGGLSEAIAGASRDEVRQIEELTVASARKDTLERQAELMRAVMGNPFSADPSTEFD